MPKKLTYEELEKRVQELEMAKSESNRLLEEVQQKEYLYHNLFKNMLHEVHVWELVFDDTDNIKTWKLVDANPAALKSWEKDLSEVVGKTTDELFPNSNPTERFMSIVKKIFTEGKPQIWESYFPDTNQFLHMVSIPLGEYFISTGLDVTERKRNEEILRQNHEMLKRTEAIAHVGSWEWEIETDTVTWSEELYRIFQLDPDGGAPNWAEHPKLYHPEDFEKLRLAAETAISQGKPYEIELRAFRKNGEIRICTAMGFPETGEDGQIVRLFGLLQDITERKQTEDALRKQNYYLEKAQELGQIGTWELDVINNVLVWTDENCRIFGVPEGSVVDYETFLSKVHPDDREYVDREWKAGVEGKPYDIEHRLLVDGEVKWVREKADLEFDDNGKAVRAIGITQDITQKKHSERSLRESRDRTEAIYAALDDAVFLVNPETRLIMECNAATERIFSYPHEELIGKDTLSLHVDQAHFEQFGRKAVAAYESPGYYETEFEMRRKDGTIFPTEHFVRPVRDSEGRVSYVVSVVRDITDRKRAEEALRESEEYHRDLFENSPTALYLQDFSGIEEQITGLKSAGITDLGSYLRANPEVALQLSRAVVFFSVNQAAVDLYKAGSKSNLLGSMDRVLIKGDLQHFIEQVVAFTNGENSWSGEARNYDFQKEIIDIVIKKAVINRQANGISKVLVSITDVTELHRAHENKERLEAQLHEAQKMESIGILAGGIAHDFNNILSIILGNTELAIGDIPEWSPARNNLKEVRKACNRAKGVIQQILSFSRRAGSEMRPINISPIIEESLKLLRASIPTSIEIRQKISPEMQNIQGDPTQIHQILLNLCTNAGHAMEETGGVLDIEIANHNLKVKEASQYTDLAPGPYLKLTVRDTGQGMTPDVLDRIFDPYFTTKEAGKGTGMGLAVVHGIVKTHRGSISVTSAPGKGTTVEVLFPAVEEKAVVKESQVGEKLPYGHERILFVDDEAALVRLNEQRLAHLGYQVETRTDPVEALELFRSQPHQFDLLITDTTMPHMTGDRLAREIMKIRPDIPILLCTGYSERVDKDTAKEIGIAGFAMKPLDMGELARTIRELLDGREKFK